MTSVNIAVTHGGQLASIVTDGAVYHAQHNRRLKSENKLQIIPQAKTVVCIRGSRLFAKLATAYCEDCWSFDEMVERFSSEWNKRTIWRAFGRSVRAYGRRRHGGRGKPCIDAFAVFFVGYSESAKRVKAVCFDSDSTPAFQQIESDQWFAPGEIDEVAAFGCLPRGMNQNDIDAWARGLLEITKMQREVHGPDSVGRFAVHTVVGAGGIRSRLLHRWTEDC